VSLRAAITAPHVNNIPTAPIPLAKAPYRWTCKTAPLLDRLRNSHWSHPVADLACANRWRVAREVEYCTIKINSSVTRHGVLDVTNFGTLSRVTEALDEYTFSSWLVQNLGSGLLCANFLSCRHSPYNFLAILKVSCFKSHKHRASDQIKTEFNRSSTVKNGFFLFNRFGEINFSDAC
jgi:hypothetical protein